MLLLPTLTILLPPLASAKSLFLPTTPQSPQPYALRKGRGISQSYGGDTVNTYPVTGNSSGGAFCILNTNGPGSSGGAGLFPHVHRKTYENFYAFKGRVQLWGQDAAGYARNTSAQQTRVLGPGDFGAIPRSTIHTFRLLEPDTQLTGVLVPGGFEEFFFSGDIDLGDPAAGAGLAKWDVYPQLDFVPRTDVVDGRAGPGNWYDGPNELPAAAQGPIWVAKNYGPRWLSEKDGRYEIVAPLVTGRQTDGMFAQGTVTISPQFSGKGARPVVRSPSATAFQVEEGLVAVTVEGFETARLIEGDVVFVPGNVSFGYVAEAEFTKFMYVSGGGDGFDAMLMKGAKEWDSAFYPKGKNSTEGPVRRRI